MSRRTPGRARTAPARPDRPLSLQTLARSSAAVLLRPRVATFAAQLPAANWRAVWLGFTALGIVQGAALALLVTRPGALRSSGLPAGAAAALAANPLLPAALGLVGTILTSLTFCGLLHLSARALGGRGSFLSLTYAISLFWVPLLA